MFFWRESPRRRLDAQLQLAICKAATFSLDRNRRKFISACTRPASARTIRWIACMRVRVNACLPPKRGVASFKMMSLARLTSCTHHSVCSQLKSLDIGVNTSVSLQPSWGCCSCAALGPATISCCLSRLPSLCACLSRHCTRCAHCLLLVMYFMSGA